MFGMLMDDDVSDNGVNFGRARGRRVVSRAGRTYAGYGEDIPTDGTGQDFDTNLQFDPNDPTGVPYVQPGGGTAQPSGGGTDIWANIAKAIGLTAQVAGDVTKIATGGNPCGSNPATPYYSATTRMCYPTPQAAQAASGGGGMLLVGALGVGLLAWLASGKGGPTVG